MQKIRLWTTALVSRVDGMVTRIENHEALAESAVRDVRQAAARASIQLRHVRRDGERQRERLEALREAATTWRERARRKSEDEATALECLRRSKQAARRAADLERRVAEHERVEQQLAADVGCVEERVARLEEQRHVLSTRQSRAEALTSVREAGAPLRADMDDVFDRWETRIAEREFAGGCFSDGDALETALDREEEDETLRAELETLRSE